MVKTSDFVKIAESVLWVNSSPSDSPITSTPTFLLISSLIFSIIYIRSLNTFYDYFIFDVTFFAQLGLCRSFWHFAFFFFFFWHIRVSRLFSTDKIEVMLLHNVFLVRCAKSVFMTTPAGGGIQVFLLISGRTIFSRDFSCIVVR